MSVREKKFGNEKGVALFMAFSVSILVLALVAALLWVTVQRHLLLKKRASSSQQQYLAEAGINDAMARLRLGLIDRVAGDTYCLNPYTTTTDFGCGAPSAAFPVYIVIAPQDANGLNQINVTVD